MPGIHTENHTCSCAQPCTLPSPPNFFAAARPPMSRVPAGAPLQCTASFFEPPGCLLLLCLLPPDPDPQHCVSLFCVNRCVIKLGWRACSERERKYLVQVGLQPGARAITQWSQQNRQQPNEMSSERNRRGGASQVPAGERSVPAAVSYRFHFTQPHSTQQQQEGAPGQESSPKGAQQVAGRSSVLAGQAVVLPSGQVSGHFTSSSPPLRQALRWT